MKKLLILISAIFMFSTSFVYANEEAQTQNQPAAEQQSEEQYEDEEYEDEQYDDEEDGEEDAETSE